MNVALADTGRRRLTDFAPAIALLLLSVAGIFGAALEPSGRNGQYAVVAPPWYDQAETIALAGQAGGRIVDVGGLANVIIVHADTPKFVAALYRAGAWLVIDPGMLRGCLGYRQNPIPASGGT
jgi:hypothetical protein